MNKSLSSLRKIVSQKWGLIFFSIMSLFSLARLLHQTAPGHYRVFTRAALKLWAQQNAYGSDLGTGVGYWFYSPTCGMLFFGPFALLPEPVGLALYMMLSWAMLTWGIKRFLKSLAPFKISARTENWFWFALTSQMVGAILASKVEIFMVGGLLLSCAWLLEGRRLQAGIFLSLLLNWKFQPLPSLLLLTLVVVFLRKDWKFPLTLILGWIGWSLLPLLYLGKTLFLEIHSTWSSTFSSFVHEGWKDFENLFAFMQNSLDLSLTYQDTQILSVLFGVGCAAVLSFWLHHHKSQADYALKGGTLLALALGSTFICIFSPLGQNNALILFTPLLIAGFFSFDSAKGTLREVWRLALLCLWAVMTLPYSDLVPMQERVMLRHFVVKPPGILLFSALLMSLIFGRKWLVSRVD